MIPPNIVERIDEATRRRITAFPHHVNHASSIGAACVRQLVYQRTHWQDATLPTLAAKRVYELGNRIERDTIRAMVDAGIEVIEQQNTLSDFLDIELTCHVDGVIPVQTEHGPRGMPFDVKSMHPAIWDGIFFRGADVYQWSEVAAGFERKPWLRKYRPQIQLYALAKTCEVGLLICVNKSTAEVAQVVCPLDIDYCATLEEKCKAINAHVHMGTLPDRIPWDEQECGGCPFLHLCLPDHVGREPIAFLETPELTALLAARETTQAAHLEYEAADARLKAWAKARPEPRLCVDHWLIEKKAQKNGVRVTLTRVGQAAPQEEKAA